MCRALKFMCSKPVISPWTRRPMGSPHGCETLSALPVNRTRSFSDDTPQIARQYTGSYAGNEKRGGHVGGIRLLWVFPLRAVEQTVKVVRRRRNGALRFVYRHFPPARFHTTSQRAAEAAEAAGAQGRFWEMHHLLLKHARNLDDA